MSKLLKAFRHLGHIIFGLGLFLTVVAFFVDKSERFPFIQELFSPQSKAAREGLKYLQEQNVLRPGDVGFTEIEIVFRKQFEDDPRFKQWIEFRKITEIKSIGTVMDRHGTRVQVQVIFLDRTFGEWDTESINRGIQSLSSDRIFCISLAILFSGVAISVLGRVAEHNDLSNVYSRIKRSIGGVKRQAKVPSKRRVKTENGRNKEDDDDDDDDD